jgi:hypothetical protein
VEEETVFKIKIKILIFIEERMKKNCRIYYKYLIFQKTMRIIFNPIKNKLIKKIIYYFAK